MIHAATATLHFHPKKLWEVTVDESMTFRATRFDSIRPHILALLANQYPKEDSFDLVIQCRVDSESPLSDAIYRIRDIDSHIKEALDYYDDELLKLIRTMKDENRLTQKEIAGLLEMRQQKVSELLKGSQYVRSA